jgi:hypothetical protein
LTTQPIARKINNKEFRDGQALCMYLFEVPDENKAHQGNKQKKNAMVKCATYN